MKRYKRPICYLFGCFVACTSEYHGEYCDRCEADEEEGDLVIGPGLFRRVYWKIRSWWHRLQWFCGHVCEGADCERVIRFSNERTCSDECTENWMPF